MSDVPVDRIKMTIEEFKQLPETVQPTELIDGELIVSPTPRYSHQRLVLNIAKTLDELDIAGAIVLSPSDLYLKDNNVLQPDIFWVSDTNENCQLEDDDYWHGAPDLVVEVLSPGTAKRDKTSKFTIYESNAIPEYWIADPYNETLEVYVLENAEFKRQGVYGENDSFKSPVLRKDVDLKKIFPN